MSFVTDSPIHSSSSDDFAALLDAELEVGSSGSSPDEQDDEDEEADVDANNNDDDDDDNDDDLDSRRNKRCRTEKLEDLEEPEGSTSQGLIEEKIEVSLKEDICTHPGSFGQMCILCGQRLDDESGVTFGYIHKAWMKHKDNLILMERYHFFALSCHQFGYNCKSLSQLKNDESESDGALASVLKVLRQIHHIFFDELDSNLASRDVRQVLKTVRKEVLKGCKIVFSRVFPTKFQADSHLLWKMAEHLGASCSTETDSSVTHVVSTDSGTEKSRWAVKEKKLLVHPRWIEAANFLWQKQPEENFPVSQAKNQ